MPLKFRCSFDGGWRPDLPADVVGGNGLTECTDVVREGSGYRRKLTWDLLNVTGTDGGSGTPATGSSTIDDVCTGSFNAQNPIGGFWGGSTEFNMTAYAATYDHIWQLYDPAYGWSEVTPVNWLAAASGGLGLPSVTGNPAATTVRQFAQYGDDVFVCSGISATQACDLYYQSINTGGRFAAVNAEAPQCWVLSVVGQHLVAGDFKSSPGGSYGVGVGNNGIWWSAIGNPFSWPEPGTETAIAAQSDYRYLEKTGGRVHAIIGKPDYGIILQKKAIWAMQYVGGAVMYEFRNIANDHGCYLRHMAVDTPVGVLFLDTDGFYLCDGNTIQPVGTGKTRWHIMRWVRLINPTNWYKCSLTVDYRERQVIFATPDDSGSGAHRCKHIYVWNWETDEWVYWDDDVNRLFNFECGQPRPYLAQFDTDRKVYILNEKNDSATLATGDVELNQDGRATVLRVRPLAEGQTYQDTMYGYTGSTLEVASRAERSDALVWSTPIDLNSYGWFDVRADGRFHRFRLNLTGGGGDSYQGDQWTGSWIATGLDVDYEVSGGR